MSNKNINSFLIGKGYIKNDEQITVLKMVELVDEWQKQVQQEKNLNIDFVSSMLPKKPCKTTSEVAESFYKKGNMMYAVEILSVNTSMTLKECKEYADTNYC
jgi:hypothetical protein